jgi:hypothetical protein
LLTYGNEDGWGGGADNGDVAQSTLGDGVGTSGASPAAMMAPAGAVDLGQALGEVILAQIVVKQHGGDEVWS